MPHAIVRGDVTPELVVREIGPFTERSDGLILKVGEGYLSRSGDKALFESVVVDGSTGTSLRFLTEVDRREDGVTVRLFPPTDPEKTDGVRRLAARFAMRVRDLDERAAIVRSNLGPFLVGAD